MSAIDLLVLKGTNFQFVFAITAAGVLPCGGTKQSPCSLSTVQIIFEPCHEKTNNLHMRKQRRKSASG